MSKIYEDKCDCKFCNNTGKIMVYNFKYISIANRLAWNTEARLSAIKNQQDCPLCNGKGYLHFMVKYK